MRVFVGVCHCFPGWTGSNCGKMCPAGTYGINCGFRCKCQNASSCRAIDGACHCKPGYTGPTCSEGKCFVSFNSVWMHSRTTLLDNLYLMCIIRFIFCLSIYLTTVFLNHFHSVPRPVLRRSLHVDMQLYQ